MFATPDTEHFHHRAAERGLPEGVEQFLRIWGTEFWAADAMQITLIRKDLPPELRDSPIARRAEGWILVAAPNGALLTCYRRNDAGRFVHRKAGYSPRPRRHKRR